jgi:von Willebrand factor type A C-terminal domain
MSRHVAHYTGQAELAQAIQDGLEARKAGDEDTAKLLAKVVDVIDPATGTIRLKAKVADADEMALDTRSTKTVRARK